MNQQEYESIVESVEREQSGGNPFSIIDPLSDEHTFIRPLLKYDEDRKCIKCGETYHLSTPYSMCQEGSRDLCDLCIITLPKLDKLWSDTKREEDE